MIPRPLTDDAARYNPGRWVCNVKPEICNGMFRVYGQDMPCPLYARCLCGDTTKYQYPLGKKYMGHYQVLYTDSDRARKRALQDRVYKRLFGGVKSKPRTAEQKERDAAWAREKRRRDREANPKPVALPERPLLPCGEDCAGGCPYDGPCPYTDADIDALVARAAHDKALAQGRAQKARTRAREAADPEFRAHQLELARVRQRRYYNAHKAELRTYYRERERQKTGYYPRHKEAGQ